MKKLYISAALMLLAITAGGKDKLNPSGRFLYNEYKDRISTLSAQGDDAQPALRQGMLIEVTDDADISSIVNLGFEINNIMGNVISGSIDMAGVEALESLDQVLNISFGEIYSVQLDYARPATMADQVQDGFEYSGTSCSFDGTGVIAGMMDTGLEANHVNFHTSDGSSRIEQLWHFTGTSGNSSVRKYNPDNIFRFTTDSNEGSHATHVAGIMSGSYKGNAAFYKTNNPMFGSSTKYDNAPCPYFGVATGSSLAFAVGSLSNSNIADGVANIAEYAQSVNKPAVINLSIGSTTGPHDGSDLLSKVFSYYGNDAIICVASGNDGDASIYAGKTFTADDTEMKLQFVNNRASGFVDVWGNDAKTFKFQWTAYNSSTRTFELISDITPGSEIRINSSNEIFAKYFTGSIRTTAGVSSLNNRYQVYNECSSVAPRATNTNVKLAIVISGVSEQSIYAYGSTGTTGGAEFASDIYLPGWTDGTTTNSINNLACGSNIISVGSYNTRAYWTCLDGNTYTLQGGVSVNDISNFSSYGTNFQENQLPLVTAPGCCIVSSINRYNVNSANEQSAQAINMTDGSYDYWGEMQGTSMACPMVSGIIALWLQADPTLTYGEVAEIIAETSITDRYTRKAPERFGAGKIDALAGIKKVLDDKASVGTIFADDERNFILTPIDGGYNVYVAGESQLTVTLYDAAGRSVSATSSDGNTVDVDTSSLRQGVYILSAKGNTQLHNAKIAVK